VIGVVDRAFLAPGQIEARGDDDLRPQPAECRREVAPERYSVLDQPVNVIQKLHLGDADDRRAAPLLFDPQRRDFCGRHACDSRLAPGGEQVGDCLALRGPAGDRGRGAVLEIIRVRNHRYGAFPVLRDWLHLVSSQVGRSGQAVSD
jgi:hypothetical protein